MKNLTENQHAAIGVLRARGAHFTAQALENAWRNGESFCLDRRCSAARGIRRKIAKGNAEALGGEK